MVREERTIEVTLISATDLKKVKKFGREQKNYVSAYIYPSRRQSVGADPYGGVNPIWNTKLKLTCYESDLFPAATSSGGPAASSSSAHDMILEIYSHGGGIFHTADKLVGTVTVPLQQVASAAQAGGAMPTFAVHLPTESGEVQGSLNLSVKLGAKRELGDYEDITAAPLSSYSDQVAPSLLYPSLQPSSYKSQGQSSYGNYPPASDYTPSTPNHNTIAAAAAREEDFVTGYPAPGYYAFAPLGQLPMERQEQLGPETSAAHGTYVIHSPDEGTHHQTRRERRQERREKKWDRRIERREKKQDRRSERMEGKKKRWAAMGKHGPAIQVALLTLQVITVGLI